jgi:hypothetical protein
VRDTVVVDLDGTLANIDHRTHLVKKEKPEWDAFYAACDKDTPNDWCVNLINALLVDTYRVVIVSARRRDTMDKTQRWLKEVFPLRLPGLVLLRKDNDHSEDTELKREWLRTYGREKILFVVDDRQKVVDMWRSEGLVCLQCYQWEEYKKPKNEMTPAPGGEG